jgi:trimeric autotransporter adhesin
MKTLSNIIYPALTAFALACFALSPTAWAVTPAPDGGYPGRNTAEGDDALFSLTTGESNTAIGFVALSSNTTGIRNTATGDSALFANTTGQSNTALGVGALGLNTMGSFNTAVGDGALNNNTEGVNNSAFGWGALANNTVDNNTAVGAFALTSNTTGDINTATGVVALYSNTTGHRNTATGQQSLAFNTEGYRNTADGFSALFANTTGNLNTACGWVSLGDNTIGNKNTAVGFGAGWDLTTGDNNIDIGNLGVPAESNTIRIGTVVQSTKQGFVFPVHTATYVAGISGTTISRGATVFVDSNGRLGTRSSSQRFKDDIRPMDKTSEAIHALKPVTFHYKKELDPDGIPQFGLVAEEVAAVNPDLVVRDQNGEMYTVRYEAVNAMLLNEFLKEHRKVEEQEATIAQLRSNDAQQQQEIKALAVTVKEQASQIQKVSAQLELTKRAPQTVANR